MITVNITYRVFRIKSSSGSATAFTIDVDDRQYLVTAKHVIKDSSISSTLEIFSSGSWTPLSVRFAGVAEGDADIAVVAADQLLTDPQLPVVPSMDGLVYGQDVYFLGFPYDIEPQLLFGTQFPMPLVRKGIVAATDRDTLILDGHNNPGFSGAPVCFFRTHERTTRIAAVISGYHSVFEPIYDETGSQTPFSYQDNTGLVVAYDIRHALEIIKINPVGFSTKKH